MPRFSEDDVLDFLVTEALVERGENDCKHTEKEAEKDVFRKSHKGWDPRKVTTPGG